MLVRFGPDEFPPETQPCVRCGEPAAMRFAGPCPRCTAELRAAFASVERVVDAAEYVPKVNVTPNAVALKDD